MLNLVEHAFFITLRPYCLISYFSLKAYVLGTHWKSLISQGHTGMLNISIFDPRSLSAPCLLNTYEFFQNLMCCSLGTLNGVDLIW